MIYGFRIALLRLKALISYWYQQCNRLNLLLLNELSSQEISGEGHAAEWSLEDDAQSSLDVDAGDSAAK